MLQILLALSLLGLSLFAISLRKTYSLTPRKELKRQARAGDEIAQMLYRAVAYGSTLRLFLWLVIGLSAAGGFILLAVIAPAWMAFLAVVGLLWYGFAWMPESQVTAFGARLVLAATPAVSWLLNLLHPVLYRLTSFVKTRRPITFHTGLFEREDLIELIELQRAMPDNRIPNEELDVVIHALSFGEMLVQEVMVPRRIVRMVPETDVVGPILMKELHDSGHSRFPVYQNTKEVITGTLYIRDLLEAKHGERVKEVMQSAVYYVHEDATLYQVLHAFIKTKHHMFVVVNSFEEFVGIITIEDVLEQVIGHKIEDEFDRYDDMRAVARSHALREHKGRRTVPETVTEVVE